VVLSGVVKVQSARTGGGETIVVELSGPGDLVGYADFAEGCSERSQIFEARALTNCCVALITRHHIVEVLKSLDPEAVLRLAETLNSMWSSVAHRYANFLGMSLRKRLEMVFAELANRFGVPDARGILLTPELAQEELAEMIGSSRPMVSKLLTEMSRPGLLIREGKRHILLGTWKTEQKGGATTGNGSGSGASNGSLNMRRPVAPERLARAPRGSTSPAAA
ncbi:MAG: Crp/Fnr family transcriptional regulator, partial [Candidatus Binataceae bacterium]